jgi:hypothetical protein
MTGDFLSYAAGNGKPVAIYKNFR